MGHVLFPALLPKAHKAQSSFTICYSTTCLCAAQPREGMKNGVPLEQPTVVGSKARWTPLHGATAQTHLLITQQPEGPGHACAALQAESWWVQTFEGALHHHVWASADISMRNTEQTPSSPPPNNGCLVLAPKKLCSFRKAWEVVMQQQESLAVLLGHTSGTQVWETPSTKIPPGTTDGDTWAEIPCWVV